MIRRWFNLALLVFLSLQVLACLPASAQRQGADSFRSYVTPFPADDVYKIGVIGDSWAEGLMYALGDAFGSATRVSVVKEHTALWSLTRGDLDKTLERLNAGETATLNVALVMVGANDRQSIRRSGQKRLRLGSDEWKADYASRVDQLILALKKRKVAIYWIGGPILRGGEESTDMQMINTIFQERAAYHGIRYIDIFASFVNEDGEYSSYGPDVTGRSRLLRSRDGIYFTGAGYAKLAYFIERVIQRDLTEARAERVLPLAGSEADQKRLIVRRPVATGKGPGWTTTSTPAGGGQARAGGSGIADQRADNTRIRLSVAGENGRLEQVSVDVLRPALSGSVIALFTRRESKNRASQLGDALVDEINGGLAVVSTVTPWAEVKAGQRRVPPTYTPYYRALVKGERLPSKPGRIDDHDWPPAGEPGGGRSSERGQPATGKRRPG